MDIPTCLSWTPEPGESPEESRERAKVARYLIVFDGSSREDVSHARQLWSSLSLLPPQESRLVSADICQRLPVSQRQPPLRGPGADSVTEPGPLSLDSARKEERRRYEALAETRLEVLALLQRQREQRVQRELLSVAFKPKPRPPNPNSEGPVEEGNRDRELVQQLPPPRRDRAGVP